MEALYNSNTNTNTNTNINTSTIAIKYAKSFGCNIHGHVRVSNLALKIIDTPEFQRLRNIKQLGLCSFVFSANHTRFEHSIGVYYLANQVVNKLQSSYPDKIYHIPELGDTILTNFIGELIKIAGLCHDIGHGPFSHVFDKIMHTVTDDPNAEHEVRSCLLIERICKRELGDILNHDHIKFIQSIIHPKEEHTGAIYQIVANNLNGIDVDKFDYLARDTYNIGFKKGFDSRRIIDDIIINDEGDIAYAKHCSAEIYDLFQTRYMMHKQVYNHKTVKIMETMIWDIFIKIDPIFHISDTINDMDKFYKLTDNTIFFLLENIIDSPYHLKSELNEKDLEIVKEAYDIYQNIIKRKLYKCIGEISEKTPDYFYNFIKYLGNNIVINDLQIVTTEFGFANTNTNPFDSIYFYDSKITVCPSSFLLDKNQISSLLCDRYVENKHFLLCKNRDKYMEVLELYKKYI
jgi:HD superfamily phosphohydrolase